MVRIKCGGLGSQTAIIFLQFHHPKVFHMIGEGNFVLDCLHIPESCFLICFDCPVITSRNAKQNSSGVAFHSADFLDTAGYKGRTISLACKLRCHRPANPKIITFVLTSYLSKNDPITDQAELFYAPYGLVQQILVMMAYEAVSLIGSFVLPLGDLRYSFS